MKKNTKILVFVLSLVLLIGAAMSVSAAEETPAPEIMAKNVIYGADIRFQFAIDATELGANKTITVKIYDADPAGEANLLDTTTAVYDADVTDTNLGVQAAYIVEKTNAAISAVAFGEEFWAVAECDGVQGKAIKYSAVEYFLERLYADADKITEVQKEHYVNAIAYGSTAQLVTGDTKTNVADYLYVMAKDGKVNGAEGAIALKGDALNFTYTGTEDATSIAYWLDPTGAKTATATESGFYTARFADFTFNDLSTAATFTPSTMGSTGLKGVTVKDGDKDVSKYAGLLYGNVGVVGRTYSFSVTEDQRLKYATPQGGTALSFVNTKNVESGHNYSVFETDIQLDLGEKTDGTQTASSVWTVDLTESSSTTMYRWIFQYTAADGMVKVYFQRNNAYSGVSYKDTSHYSIKIAEANTYSVSFKLKVENYYIAETKDTACVISFNDKPMYIADTRAQKYDTDCPTSDADVQAFLNSDGAYVTPLGHYSVSTSDDTPRSATTFKGININPNSDYICDIYFDNIIFEAKKIDAIPKLNIEMP